jgi:hypothetical protein
MPDENKSLTKDIYIKAAPRPVTDLSLRSVKIGRILDRLGPGQYFITLVKHVTDGDRPETWSVRIAQDLTVREIEV